VTFRLIAPGSGVYLPNYGEPCNSPNWYSIDGLATFIQDYTLCDSCNSVNCGGDVPPNEAVPEGGVTWTWNGTEVDGSGSRTCNGVNGTLSCGTVVCAPAGDYTAKLCDWGDSCVSLPFHYPTSEEVVGTILPPDAGG
jgi:hypothetical protein